MVREYIPVYFYSSHETKKVNNWSVTRWLLAAHIPKCDITSMAFCFFQQEKLFQNQLQLTNVEIKAKSSCQIVGNAQIHQNISIAYFFFEKSEI